MIGDCRGNPPSFYYNSSGLEIAGYFYFILLLQDILPLPCYTVQDWRGDCRIFLLYPIIQYRIGDCRIFLLYPITVYIQYRRGDCRGNPPSFCCNSLGLEIAGFSFFTLLYSTGLEIAGFSFFTLLYSTGLEIAGYFSFTLL